MPLDFSFTLTDEDLEDLGYDAETIAVITDAERARIEARVELDFDTHGETTEILKRVLASEGLTKEDLAEVLEERRFVQTTKNDPALFCAEPKKEASNGR